MADSQSKFLIINLALIVLIGVMFWYFAFNEDKEYISVSNSEQSPAPVTAISSNTGSLDSLPDSEAQAIREIQSQIEEERARADQTRAQLQARQISAALNTQQNQGGTDPSAPPMDVESQREQIAAMIEAQLKGVRSENQRLNQALEEKDKEIEVVKQQNTVLVTRLSEFDKDTKTLLNELIENNNNISQSDQSYLRALDGGNQPAAAATDADLINRVEVADTPATDTISGQLRARVGELMKAENKPGGVVSTNTSTTQNARQAENLPQTTQSGSDAEYLGSLDPIEQERSSETRWVTVRSGDTLYDIAVRVYNDGWRYQKIFDANPQLLSNPDLIRPGQRLRVPL